MLTLAIYRLLLSGALVMISYLAFTGAPPEVTQQVGDKWNHGLAFFTLALLTHKAFPQQSLYLKATLLIGYAIAIEVIQSFLSYRDASFLDLVADGAGLVLFAVFQMGVNKITNNLRGSEEAGP